MYANIGIMMGSWHTPQYDENATINAIGALRIAPTRDLPIAPVMASLFDACVEQFKSAMDLCDRSRFKALLHSYQPGNYVHITHVELYTFEEANAPEIVELHSRFWLDCLYSYHPVQHLRFDSVGGYTTAELRQSAGRV